jgi:hypothetical protein
MWLHLIPENIDFDHLSGIQRPVSPTGQFSLVERMLLSE